MSVTLTSERQKLADKASLPFATNTRVRALVFGAAMILGVNFAPHASSQEARAAGNQACASTADMLGKGLDAWKENRYEIALPAFDCVLRADNNLQKFYAEFYTARILSDSSSKFVDHIRAYTLFQSLADASDTVDPEDMRRAPFVAKSVTAVAGYVRKGMPEIGLRPDLERAVEYLRHSATIFNEPDAQFELAKLHLAGDGVPRDERLGLHYIRKLVQDSHAGAQVFLAELHWTGKHVPTDRIRALALVKLATENTAPSDRLWVEDSYQKYYCGTPAADRGKAAQLASSFRHIFARGPNIDRNVPRLGGEQALGSGRELNMVRTCANGDKIDMELKVQTNLVEQPLANSMAAQPAPQHTQPVGMRSGPTR